jgi:hypothetical protein
LYLYYVLVLSYSKYDGARAKLKSPTTVFLPRVQVERYNTYGKRDGRNFSCYSARKPEFGSKERYRKHSNSFFTTVGGTVLLLIVKVPITSTSTVFEVYRLHSVHPLAREPYRFNYENMRVENDRIPSTNNQSKYVPTISFLSTRGCNSKVIGIFVCALFSLANTRNLKLYVYLRHGTMHQQANQHVTSETVSPRRSCWTTKQEIGSSSSSRSRKDLTATGVTYPTVSRRRSRVLAGIFSADIGDDARYRYAFRELLQTHPKVCSLVDFMADEQVHAGPCELIYTFVLGGNTDKHAPTQIVSNTSTIPILVPVKPKSVNSNDFHEDDITFLNIK